MDIYVTMYYKTHFIDEYHSINGHECIDQGYCEELDAIHRVDELIELGYVAWIEILNII